MAKIKKNGIEKYQLFYENCIDKVLDFIETRTSYSLQAKLNPDYKSKIQVCLFYYEDSHEYIIHQGKNSAESQDNRNRTLKILKELEKLSSKFPEILNNCNQEYHNLLNCIDDSRDKHFNQCSRYERRERIENDNFNGDIYDVIYDVLGSYIYQYHYRNFPADPITANIQIYCDTIEEDIHSHLRTLLLSGFGRIHEEEFQRILTEIVIVHEFAHAYHHIGFDMDSKYCKNFSDLDTNYKEGYANYLTYKYCGQQTNSDLYRFVFETCTSQIGPYSVYKKWLNYTFECFRLANQSMRKDYLKTSAGDFEVELIANHTKGYK
jgi:hypothetical protein